MTSETELRAACAALQYPPYQDYDPVTLEPCGVTVRRVELMETIMPQVLAGGASLLDVGSSKGFVSFWVRDRYDRVDGYEMGTHAWNIAEAARRYHKLDHVRFVNRSFRWIEVSRLGGFQTYDVVYAGSVHHHLLKDALLHGAPVYLPLAKLAALAQRYLVLDGSFEVPRSYSLTEWAKQYGWDQGVRDRFTLDNHVAALRPQFQPVHGPLDNGRGGECIVFERVAPDLPHVDIATQEIGPRVPALKAIPAGAARECGSVMRRGDRRYKFDAAGMQSDGVLMILNHMPQWFAHTHAAMVHAGRRIGDVAEWVEGEPIGSAKELVVPWLRLNDALASIGLVEPHFRVNDFVRRGTDVVDVDVDMVDHVGRTAAAARYLAQFKENNAGTFGAALVERIAGHLSDEWVFRDALKELTDAAVS